MEDSNADLSKRIYLECECTDFDHTVRVSLWDWNNYTDPALSQAPEMIVEYHLNNHEKWYQRVWSAIKYVFNQESIVYHDVMVDPAGVEKLQRLCADYKIAHELYKLGTTDNGK
jgi:hypothetical protein